MGKMYIITLVLVVLVAALSGCAKASIQPEDTTPEPTGTEEQAASSDPEPAEKIAEKAVDAEGRLNGWIDNNSVEIAITDEDILAFRISEVVDQMEGINDGDMVKFTYAENESGQLVISKIEKVR